MLDGKEIPTGTPEKAYTGYKFEGKEIVAVRKGGAPKKYRNPTYFDQERKTDAATLYCVYGDLEEVSKLTDVPLQFLRQWKEEAWWVEIQKRVFVEQNDKLSSRISTVLNKSIEQIEERLTNGDQTYNPKTGEISRKPIEARVLASLFETLSHQRRITRGEPTAISARVSVDDRLVRLEKAFITYSQMKTVEGEVKDAVEP
jgi:hypothetical protein